jgi:hypothetical protein
MELVFNYASAHSPVVGGLPCKDIAVLSKNDSNSASSSGERSWEIITALSGTLGSRGTLFVSHFGSMTSLLVLLASFLTVLMFFWPLASSSCK